MATPRSRRLRNALLSLSLMGVGLWLAGSALWNLGCTAVYVHGAVVVPGTVIDVRQKPFESWGETLGKGNWSWPGDVSYQPHVRFLLPGGIHAIRLDLEADNEDYRIGQEVSIISPPSQPGKAHLNRWKFLWGADCLRLGAGSLLALIGYALLRRLRGKRPAAATAASAAPVKRKSAAKSASTTAPSASAPARRKRKSASTPAEEGGPTPRRRRKTQADTSAEATVPKKPRRSRKKKAQEQSPELPF